MPRASEHTVTSLADAPIGRVEHVMGMAIVIELSSASVGQSALDRAYRWLRWVDETFSTYRDDSEISRLRAGTIARADASFAVRSVLELCESMRVQTNGYFDAWAGGSLDPSGLVKGWAVLGAARLLEQAGAGGYCVNAGGDLIARGPAPQGGPWQIGIQHPVVADAVAAVIAIDSSAVATSGAYARGDHVLDPHTGLPARGLLSVTVIGADMPTADAYATAAFAMGPAAAEWCRTRTGYEFLIITEDERMLSTRGLERFRRHEEHAVGDDRGAQATVRPARTQLI